jgi:hypothetical protein
MLAALMRWQANANREGSKLMRLRRKLAAAAACATLTAGGVVAATAPAWADYGPGNVYQVAISSNLPGKAGGGVWLWFALSPSQGSTTSGTGDYSGADCGHGGAGAAHDSGSVTWSTAGGTLTISGITLKGLGGVVVTAVVPSADGHYSYDFNTPWPGLAFLGVPAGVGFSQVQVSP